MPTQSRASLSGWHVLAVTGVLLVLSAAATAAMTVLLGFEWPGVLLYVSPVLALAVLLPVLYGTLHVLSKGARGRGEVKRPYDP